MSKSKAYAATSAKSALAATTIPRRDPADRDVQIEILFCGVCHSDLHTVRDEWSEFMPTVYPVVPGHEIVGRVTNVGPGVTKYKPGDLAAVGCMVDSDQTCPNCQAGAENYCPKVTLTYNSPDAHGTAPVTYGGYSDGIVVDERFVLRVPPNLDLAGVAPLLCAGITTYSPLRHWGVTKGKKVGVVGLGGLGHMGVKFAPRLRCAHRRLHHVARQDRGRPASGCRRGGRVQERRRDAEARRHVSTSSSTACRPTTTSTPTCTCSAGTAT